METGKKHLNDKFNLFKATGNSRSEFQGIRQARNSRREFLGIMRSQREFLAVYKISSFGYFFCEL